MTDLMKIKHDADSALDRARSCNKTAHRLGGVDDCDDCRPTFVLACNVLNLAEHIERLKESLEKCKCQRNDFARVALNQNRTKDTETIMSGILDEMDKELGLGGE